MKRKNSIVIKKVNNNQISKDKKILNFYNKFKSSIYKDVKNKSFALAVSGGADSVALLRILHLLDIDCTAVHVNRTELSIVLILA